MKTVLLLYGGNSAEHDVSCMSAQTIVKNIDRNRYKLTCVKINRNNEWFENKAKIENIIEYIKQFDIVFPMLHGKNGEDGTIQGMLDLFQIPYVGSKLGASYICMDKERTKQILNQHHIPQVPYITYHKETLDNIVFPVVVKPASGGSSIGINIAKNKKELKKAIKVAYRYDYKIIIEAYISGQELECAVLEDNKIIVSDVGEITATDHFYDYDEKYNSTESKTTIPANIPAHVKAQIQKYAKTVFELLELKGLARIDFFYDPNKDQIYLNEINTLPGFTEISMYPKLMLNKGYSYQKLITALIENAK